MFGYIRPLKPQLRIHEFETYKAVYCGLCHEMSRSLGFFSRMFLSYDFAFVALLQISLQEEAPQFQKKACFCNPLRRCKCCGRSPALSLSAAAAGMMIYYKNRDTILDGRWYEKLAGYLLLPITGHARKRAARVYPHLEPIMASYFEGQLRAEAADAPLDAA
ncbi:MAG: hypothetical protein IJC58_07745, partial [Oscillospiraceae bacterium]|nr:hypothetical protein [Oscillospiraceae bacterium]